MSKKELKFLNIITAGALLFTLLLAIDQKRSYEAKTAEPSYTPVQNLSQKPLPYQPSQRKKRELDDKRFIMDYQELGLELEQIMDEMRDQMDEDEYDIYYLNESNY